MTALSSIPRLVALPLLSAMVFGCSIPSEEASESAKPQETAPPSQVDSAEPQAVDEPLPHDMPEQGLESARSRETRFGTLQVRDTEDGEQEALYEGQSLSIVDQYVSFGPAYDFPGYTLVPVELSSGGTACPSLFRVLIVDANGVSAHDAFGNCSDRVKVLKVNDGLLLRVGAEAFLASKESGVQKTSLEVARKAELSLLLDGANKRMEYVMSPLVTPDNAFYRWWGMLERIERSDDLEMWVFSWGMNKEHTFLAFVSPSTERKVPKLQLGTHVAVVGAYTANYDVETVFGGTKTVPVLFAHRIEKP